MYYSPWVLPSGKGPHFLFIYPKEAVFTPQLGMSSWAAEITRLQRKAMFSFWSEVTYHPSDSANKSPSPFSKPCKLKYFHCKQWLPGLSYTDKLFLFLVTRWPWMRRITLKSTPSVCSPWSQKWKCKSLQSCMKQFVLQVFAFALLNTLGSISVQNRTFLHCTSVCCRSSQGLGKQQRCLSAHTAIYWAMLGSILWNFHLTVWFSFQV